MDLFCIYLSLISLVSNMNISAVCAGFRRIPVPFGTCSRSLSLRRSCCHCVTDRVISHMYFHQFKQRPDVLNSQQPVCINIMTSGLGSKFFQKCIEFDCLAIGDNRNNVIFCLCLCMNHVEQPFIFTDKTFFIKCFILIYNIPD